MKGPRNCFMAARVAVLLSLLLSFLLCPLALAESAAPAVSIKKGAHKLTRIDPKLSFSSDPADAEISAARVFQEPLFPLPSSPQALDNQVLSQALLLFKQNDDISVLTSFIEANPQSRWRPSLEANIGTWLFEHGYLTKAMKMWQSAWSATKDQTGALESVANDSLANLIQFNARIGNQKELAELLQATKGRKLQGSIEQKVTAAKEALGCMQTREDMAFRCGPIALASILAIKKPKEHSAEIDKCASTKKGTSLLELAKLSKKVALDLQIAKRSKGAEFIVPAVAHLSLDHFAAIVSKADGKYRLKDPTFGIAGTKLVSADALEEETDGYFLVPVGKLPKGWSKVSEEEAANVWGKGIIAGRNDQAQMGSGSVPTTGSSGAAGGAGGSGGGGSGSGSCPPFICCDEGAPSEGTPGGATPAAGAPAPAPGSPSGGVGSSDDSLAGSPMARVTAFTMQATTHIVDTPLAYFCPIGGLINFIASYTYLETDQPASFTFSNFGQNWNFNWLAYLTVDPSQNVTLRVRGGGSEFYDYNNASQPYFPNMYTQAKLTQTGANSYQRQMPNGSIEIFDQPDGSGRIFLTQVLDPQGNAVLVQYDANFRISTITDAIGQVSTISYVSSSLGNPGFYKIAQITDPFGRSCSFNYDADTTALLEKITDVIGLQSTFVTEPNTSFITLMTNPYGSTSMCHYIPYYNEGGVYGPRGLRFTYADGSSAVLESYVGESGYSYYWDREATKKYPGDAMNQIYTHAQSTLWLIETDIGVASSPIPVTSKPSLDNQSTYTFTNQFTLSTVHGAWEGLNPGAGSINRPISITAPTPGGTESWAYTYNSIGKVTSAVDPIGRKFTYNYAPNEIDLIEAIETKGSDTFYMGQWTYNAQHLPLSYKDGSGQQTFYTYNAFGQLLTVTDALGNITTMTYDPNGYLTLIDGPMPGNQDIATFSYDAFGRVLTVTDSVGYTITISYDAADRITLVSFPDGSTEQTIYDRLDAVQVKDRLGRWTTSSFDSLDQLRFVIDPLGRKTQFSWCSCGGISALTDPRGNTTTWLRDLEGRVITKTFQDNSAINFTWDAVGRFSTRTDALNQTTTYGYNADNSLASITYTNAVNPTSTVNYAYDQKFPRVETIANGWGTISYSYNPYINSPGATPTTGGGRPASITNNVIPNSAITFLYDAIGRRTNRSINGVSNSDTWTFDQMSRVTAESNALGNFDYHYVDNQAGASKGTLRLSRIDYPNNQSARFGYFGNTGDQRLKQVRNLGAGGTLFSEFDFDYDSVGQITLWQQQQRGNNLFYNCEYDQAGQLTGVKVGSGSPHAPYSQQLYFDHDLASNRTSVQSTAVQTVRIAGTKTTNDVLTITVKDLSLPGGQQAVSYTVKAADTLESATAQLAAAISSNGNLKQLGVNAVASGTTIYIKSVSSTVTTYAPSTSPGATETITPGIYKNGISNVTIGGTVTPVDMLTVTVNDIALPGGSKSVNYTVLPGDTTTSIATGLKNAINTDANLLLLGVTASSASNVVSISSNSTNSTTYSDSKSAGATETISTSVNMNANQLAIVGGTITAGDTLTITVYDTRLPGNKEAVTYTVLPGDSINSIAAGLSSAINANGELQSKGISATASNNLITLKSNSTQPTSYRCTTSASATESISLNFTANSTQTADLGGSKTTGDVLTITVYDSGLAGGQQAVGYTVLAADTLKTIATGLAAAINANTNLQAIGVTGNAVATTVNINSTSLNTTTYKRTLSAGATETIKLGNATGAMQAAYNNVNALTSLASGGSVKFEGGSSKPLKSLKIEGNPATLEWSQSFNGKQTLSNGNTDVSLVAKDGPNNTLAKHYQVSLPNPAGATLTHDANGNITSDGINSYAWNAENRLVKITYQNGAPVVVTDVSVGDHPWKVAITPDSKQAYVVNTSSNDVSAIDTSTNSVAATISVGTTPYMVAITPNGAKAYVANSGGGSTSVSVINTSTNTVSKTISVGNRPFWLAITPNGSEVYVANYNDGTVSVIDTSTDTVSSTISVGAGPLFVIIKPDGSRAYVSNQNSDNVSVIDTSTHTVVSSVSVGADPIYMAVIPDGSKVYVANGAVTPTVSVINTSNNTVSSTINVGGNTSFVAITPNGSKAYVCNQNTVSVINTSTDTISSSINFGGAGPYAAAVTPAGDFVYVVNFNAGSLSLINTSTDTISSTLTVGSFPTAVAISPDGNKAYVCNNGANTVSALALSSDSVQTLDPLGRCAKLEEHGTVNTTKQFLWCGSERCEERNGAGSLVSQFFPLGQKTSGSSYFYEDSGACGNVVGVVDAAGNEITSIKYEPYGASTVLFGSFIPDVGFAGMYQHPRSGLNLTLFRPYSSSLGRWLSRDPIGETSYDYCANDPINFIDPLGLKHLPYNPESSAKFSKISGTKTPRDEVILDNPFNKDAYNCHSFTFHKGKGDPKQRDKNFPRWDNDAMNDLKKYKRLGANDPNRVGDVVIYSKGTVTHSSKVTAVDKAGNTLNTMGKLGPQELYSGHPASPYLTGEYGDIDYYRK